jgi:hypothetical protein
MLFEQQDRETPNSTTFNEWIADRSLPHLSTNAGAAAVSYQGWRRFKESFAPELVARAIQETETSLGRPVECVADPFGGSGTTGLVSQFLGRSSATIEVNPFLADLIEAKLTAYDYEELAAAYIQVLSCLGTRCRSEPFPNAPATFVEPGVGGRFLFGIDVATALYDLILTIEECVANPNLRRLLKVLAVSVSVDLSNAVVSGKGRRYRRNWRDRYLDAVNVRQRFAAQVHRAMYDIRRYGLRREPAFRLLRGDARVLAKDIGPIGVGVFSPPYPNSFDYTDVYNIELWTGGYFSSAQDNLTTRNSTLRSHVQIVRSFSREGVVSDQLNRTIENLTAVRHQMWSRHIPDMVGAYFADMRTIIQQLAGQLVSGGRLYIVVGDSQYAGVSVPVSDILTEIALADGLEVVGVEPVRSMRASPQQGGAQKLPETLLILRG